MNNSIVLIYAAYNWTNESELVAIAPNREKATEIVNDLKKSNKLSVTFSTEEVSLPILLTGAEYFDHQKWVEEELAEEAEELEESKKAEKAYAEYELQEWIERDW